MSAARRRRAGAVLLEALLALGIIATAGVALLRVTESASRAVLQAQHTDNEVAKASAFLDAVSLWSVADLDRHLGVRAQGDWRMRVERDGDTYHVSVLDSARRHMLLETTLYRHASRGPYGAR